MKENLRKQCNFKEKNEKLQKIINRSYINNFNSYFMWEQRRKNSNNSNQTSVVSIESNEKEDVTSVSILIKDTVNDKEILKEDGKIDKDGLQKYLEENHKAKFEDGMMTELEGIKQDKEKINIGCIM